MAFSPGERNKYTALITSTENAGKLADPDPEVGYYNYESILLDIAEAAPVRTLIKAMYCALHAGNWVYDRVINIVKSYMHKDSEFTTNFTTTPTTIVIEEETVDTYQVDKTNTLNTVGQQITTKMGTLALTNAVNVSDGGSRKSYINDTLSFPSDGIVSVNGKTSISRVTDWRTIDRDTGVTFSSMVDRRVRPVIESLARPTEDHLQIGLNGGSCQMASKIIQSGDKPNALFAKIHVYYDINYNLDADNNVLDENGTVVNDTELYGYAIDFYTVVRPDLNKQFKLNDAAGKYANTDSWTQTYVGTVHAFGGVADGIIYIPQLPSDQSCSFIIGQLRNMDTSDTAHTIDIWSLDIQIIRTNVDNSRFQYFELDRSTLNSAETIR